MTDTAKPTPGPTNAKCFVGKKDNPIGYYPVYARIGSTRLACICKTDAHEVGFGISENEQKSNADLIAETFNVYHETNLTPRQLLEQRDALQERVRELEDALRVYCASLQVVYEPDRTIAINAADAYAKAALAKHGEGV